MNLMQCRFVATLKFLSKNELEQIEIKHFTAKLK